MNDHLLFECRKIFLTNFSVQARIGIHPFEISTPQLLLINVELYVPLSLSSSSADKIEEVVDYDFIRSAVQARIAIGHINLQETLCDDLLSIFLKHNAVSAARVSSCKPNVYADCDAVGVEVFGKKSKA